jgi:hypothetical protein
MDSASRRLELLKLDGLGFSQEEIVKELSVKCACKTAETVKEAKELIEAGFEYVCEIDGLKLFKKRK